MGKKNFIFNIIKMYLKRKNVRKRYKYFFNLLALKSLSIFYNAPKEDKEIKA